MCAVRLLFGAGQLRAAQTTAMTQRLGGGRLIERHIMADARTGLVQSDVDAGVL